MVRVWTGFKWPIGTILFITISQNACDTQNHTFTKIDDCKQ